MYGKKVKLRLLFLSFIFLIVILSVFLILKSLEENVVYFISPTEIKNLSKIDNTKRVRVGGMVKEETIKLSQNEVSFVVLYTVIKLQLVKEKIKFDAKYLTLTSEKKQAVRAQEAYKGILASNLISKI